MVVERERRGGIHVAGLLAPGTHHEHDDCNADAQSHQATADDAADEMPKPRTGVLQECGKRASTKHIRSHFAAPA